jgi:hypothetical protein
MGSIDDRGGLAAMTNYPDWTRKGCVVELIEALENRMGHQFPAGSRMVVTERFAGLSLRSVLNPLKTVTRVPAEWVRPVKRPKPTPAIARSLFDGPEQVF